MSLTPQDRALIKRVTGDRVPANLSPDGTFECSVREAHALLDAARAEGPVQEACDHVWPGHSKGILASRGSFNCTKCGAPKVLHVDAPPVDEVGRAVERLEDYTGWLEAPGDEDTPYGSLDSADDKASDLRLILSHVSRLEGDRDGWAEIAKERDAAGVEHWDRAETAESSLKLAVEALERVTDHLDVWACDRAQDRTAETDASIFCAREALRSISSLRPSVSTPGGDVKRPDSLGVRGERPAAIPRTGTSRLAAGLGEPRDAAWMVPVRWRAGGDHRPRSATGEPTLRKLPMSEAPIRYPERVLYRAKRNLWWPIVARLIGEKANAK